MEFEQIKEELKNILSEKRYMHSLGVAKRAGELAKIYGEDEKKAKIIGLVHDIAKEMPKEEALEYVKQNGIIFDEIEKNQPALWHSKIGADIAKKRYGFSEEMQQAIIYHTVGNVNMNTMDKIIYIADKTEENRKFTDLEKIIEIANEDLDEGVLYISRFAIVKNIEKQTLIHPDTIHLINQIIMNRNGLN